MSAEAGVCVFTHTYRDRDRDRDRERESPLLVGRPTMIVVYDRDLDWIPSSQPAYLATDSTLNAAADSEHL